MPATTPRTPIASTRCRWTDTCSASPWPRCRSSGGGPEARSEPCPQDPARLLLHRGLASGARTLAMPYGDGKVDRQQVRLDPFAVTAVIVAATGAEPHLFLGLMRRRRVRRGDQGFGWCA